MLHEDTASAEDKPPEVKLRLYSMRRLEVLLSMDRARLRFISAHAGSHYRPFAKRERARPFQKKLKPPRKKPRIIDNPNKELKNLQKVINKSLLKPLAFPHYLCASIPGKTVLDNVL